MGSKEGSKTQDSHHVKKSQEENKDPNKDYIKTRQNFELEDKQFEKSIDM